MLIVLIPMVSVAVVLFRLIDDSQEGKADAAARARAGVVMNLYRQAIADADRVAREEVVVDERFAAALRAGDLGEARERAEQLAAGEPIARIVLVDDGEVVLDVGPKDAVAVADNDLRGDFGRLQVSVTRAAGFTRRVKRLAADPPESEPRAGLDLVVRADDRLLHSSMEGVGEDPLPRLGTIEGPEGEALRVVSFDAPGFRGNRIVVSVLADRQALGGATRPRLVAGGILLGFFLLALVFAVAVSRQLQQQVARLLEAARRLGSGDFSVKVPTEGRDEFSALSEEFNKMSEQLSTRLAELSLERERVQTSVRRLGEAVGSNLDRDTLLSLVVHTAVEGVDAHGGRVTIRPLGEGPMEEAARAGHLRGLEPALNEVEGRVLRAGAFAEVNAKGCSALAYPLVEGEGEHRRAHGVVSVARQGAPFRAPDRELFQYLAAQAAMSIENVDLHEAVSRESVTDELTGLSNYRRFYEALEREVERSRRFGGRLGLVMMDIDDFKLVNDTRGHPQGDEVLREIGRVLCESSREIDEPARHGGEEMAVILPGTDLDGAFRLAERIRRRIEALEIGPVEGSGRPLRVTASFGVASLPETGSDERSLVAGADAALYEAKRAGKNQTMRARTQ